MVTMTKIDQMPMNWDSDQDGFGDGWGESGIHPGKVWREMFAEWLDANYPDLALTGNEIIGPASYCYGEPYDEKNHCWKMERDTPRPSDLKELPDDGLYEEFQSSIQSDICEAIMTYAETHGMVGEPYEE
jgi:hypothetical protein